MIRREQLGTGHAASEVGRSTQSTTGDSSSPTWILIPQIDHAHISGDLADAWRFDDFSAEFDADSAASFLEAIRYAARHHDDGWADWDERPCVDKQGRPINFDEMRLCDSLSIWERSIELSTNHSPLAGYLVAGHFCRLLCRFNSWQNNPTNGPLARKFLDGQAQQMSAKLAAWQFGDQEGRRQMAELGVSYVQLFDAVSLWLCCAQRWQPWVVTLPTGQTLTFRPQRAEKFSIEPWPLTPLRLDLHAAAYADVRVPAGADTVDLSTARATELTWELVAAE